MKVRDLMSEGVTTIEEGMTCHDAVERMMRRRIRHLAVVDKRGGLCGKSVRVGQIMSAPPITIEANEALENATRLMLERKIGSLPVLERGRLVGILTETDVLRRIVGDDACCADVETIVVSYP
jgi:acetoin utilization protein AcuB